MKLYNKLNEYTSYDELNAEGRGKSKLLPLILAIDKFKGKQNKVNVSLKNTKDYYTFYQQLVKAGNRISILNLRGEEIGPQKFEQCLNLLGIEDSTDLQDFLKDPFYTELFKKEGVTFSFSKEERAEARRNASIVKSKGQLAEIGVTYDGEGVSWEWGTDEESDKRMIAPEGRQIWVIRSHYYDQGFPCMFVYPYEGFKISDYSTALDKFYMNLSTEAGYMKEFVNTKEFNPLWVACPCYYDWFLTHPVPEPGESIEEIEAAERQRAAEESDYNTYDIEESLKTDRKALKRLVESYGKKDVIKFVNHLKENVDEDMPIFFYYNVILREELEKLDKSGNMHYDAETKEDLLDEYASNTSLKISLAQTQDYADLDDYYDTLMVELHDINDFRKLINFFAMVNDAEFDESFEEFERLLTRGYSDFCELSEQNDPRDLEEMRSWVNRFVISSRQIL